MSLFKNLLTLPIDRCIMDTSKRTNGLPPLESVRKLDNMDGKQGSKNAPHYHINLGKIINRILKGGNNG